MKLKGISMGNYTYTCCFCCRNLYRVGADPGETSALRISELLPE
jgi:hypothetical protein